MAAAVLEGGAFERVGGDQAGLLPKLLAVLSSGCRAEGDPPERELGPAVGALGTDDLDDLVAAEHGEDPAYARPVADDERLVVAGDLGERGGDGVFRVHRPFGIAFFEHGAADVAVLLVDVRPLPFLSFRRLEKGNRLRGREREWRVESRER